MRAHPPSDCASKIEPYAVQKQLCMKECSGSYTLVSKASPGGRLQNSVEGQLHNRSIKTHFFHFFLQNSFSKNIEKSRKKMENFVFQKIFFQKNIFFRFNYHNRSVAFACTHPGLVRTKGDQVGSKGTKQTSVSKMIKFIKNRLGSCFDPGG